WQHAIEMTTVARAGGLPAYPSAILEKRIDEERAVLVIHGALIPLAARVGLRGASPEEQRETKHEKVSHADFCAAFLAAQRAFMEAARRARPSGVRLRFRFFGPLAFAVGLAAAFPPLARAQRALTAATMRARASGDSLRLLRLLPGASVAVAA